MTYTSETQFSLLKIFQDHNNQAF